MRAFALASLSALSLLAQPALAQPDEKESAPQSAPRPAQPLTNRDVGPMDVAQTPITDLNIKRSEIPKLLIDAQTSAYKTAGLARCSQIAAEVGEFDAVLGQDFDLPATAGRRVSPGRVAQSVVGSFIPFRGIVRELSGANANDRALQSAIAAGLARRAFLKGYGEAKGCRYPARSAPREVWDAHVSANQPAAEEEAEAGDKVAARRRK